MENIQSPWPWLCQHALDFGCHNPNPPQYDVFINHRGKDVKDTVASLVYHNLQNKGLKVFLDKKSIQIGHKLTQSIEHAIRGASVHVAIFSANYVESEWCLSELFLMLKTGLPVIPIFCGIRPSELRMEEPGGAYARAFRAQKLSRKFSPDTLAEWEDALCTASYIEGIIFAGDQGELLEQIAKSVNSHISAAKSLPSSRNWSSSSWMLNRGTWAISMLCMSLMAYVICSI